MRGAQSLANYEVYIKTYLFFSKAALLHNFMFYGRIHLKNKNKSAPNSSYRLNN